MKLISFTSKGIYCPPGGFYIDPWKPVDYAVITHAHSDHARWGSGKYLCHHYTKPVLLQRLGEVNVESIGYGESRTINGVKLSLHPAGHILGSAQVRLEYKGYVSVISGDYKTQYDGLSAPFEPVSCHEFVSESTFGLPIYNWMPNSSIIEDMQHWVLQNQARNKTSVFVGYALGKAQRLMLALQEMGPLYIHYAIANINESFREAGIQLPEAITLSPEHTKRDLQNRVIIVPPALVGSNALKKVPNAAIATCSGWMAVRGNRRWQSVDAGFAISDHADWTGLLSAIKATGAEKVWVTHGYTSTFARYLNELGFDAHEVKTQYGEEAEEQDGLAPQETEDKS